MLTIVTIKPGADPAHVRRALAARGLWVRPLAAQTQDGAQGPAQLAIEPHSAAIDPDALLAVEGVAAVSAPPSEHPRMDAHPATVRIGAVTIGGGAAVFMAGPCSVESEAQVRALAETLARAGAHFLRGGAFKPRTSPYSFQGHGQTALRWMRQAADDHGLLVVTEAMAPDEVMPVAEHADLLQIGSRNMYNAPLLRAAGRAGRPVLLKRGMSATIEEWLCAAEYCLLHGAPHVVLCERGVRGIDPGTRNLLDLGGVALLAHARRLPVIVDPSHGVGRRDLIPPLCKAALAAGACGLMIETHADPGCALSDGPQALLPEQLAHLLDELRRTHP
jgi:3-deoxy-7-phosphoheptulonate synthase